MATLYLESFGNPRTFVRIARRMARHTPIVAVKSGLTRPGPEAGGAAMGASWSAGDLTDAAIDAMLAQSGVIRVDTPTQLFDAARVLSTQPVPAGRRVAIVSNARGASVLAVDACIGAGLETPEPSPASAWRAWPGRCRRACLSNPFELTWEAGPDAYRAAVAAALADDAFDAVMVLYAAPVLPGPAEVASAVGDARSGADKPVIATFLGSEPGDEVDGVQPGLPIFRFPARAPAHSVAWPPTASGSAGRPAPCPCPTRSASTSPPCRPGWRRCSPPTPRAAPSSTPRPPTSWRSPVCRRACRAGARSRRGRRRRPGHGLSRGAQGQRGRPLPPGRGRRSGPRPPRRRRPAGGLRAHGHHPALGHGAGDRAEEQPAGADVLVAGQQHPTFGGVVTVGLGGAAAAANADLPVRVLPISDTDSVGAGRRLAGRGTALGPEAGGRASVASGELAALLVRFAALLEHVPELAGVVANPVIVGPDGVLITDAWVRVAPYRVPSSPEVRRLDGAPGLFLGLEHDDRRATVVRGSPTSTKASATRCPRPRPW